MYFLAVIPIAFVAIFYAYDTLNNNGSSSSSSSSQSATTTPGLDFGTGTMFDQIATRYDTINRVLALRMDIGWRRQMTTRIKELLLLSDKDDNDEDGQQQQSSWRILDMATGTADVALQLVKDLSSTSSSTTSSSSGKPTTVLGLDPSENMLSVGRSKIQDRNLQHKIVLERADARDLSKYYTTSTSTDDDNANKNNENKFDAATMAFGIRNVVPNRNQALCEIHKLLKPMGVLAILEFSQPSYESDGIMGAAAGIFIKHVVPFVGGILSGGARQEYLHLQNSINEFPSPEEFRSILQHDLECPLRDDDDDSYFYVGYYEMEEVRHMNFGSVQLYIGRAAVKQKVALRKDDDDDDTKLPPIGGI